MNTNELSWEEKHSICNRLTEFVQFQCKNSQKNASVKLNISNATISNIISHKWQSISDEMFRKISASIGGVTTEWNIVEDITTTSRLIQYLTDSQQQSLVFGIVNSEGSGKSKGIELFAQKNNNVMVISCKEYMEPKDFVLQLFKCIGKEPSSTRVYPMMEELLEEIRSLYKPIIILDEADKLQSKVLSFFITFYNDLEEICGINLIATSYLEKFIKAGYNNNRKGFREIYSRLDKKFQQLGEINYSDVYKICHANGVTDDAKVQKIFDGCMGDLRRVKKLVKAQQLKSSSNG